MERDFVTLTSFLDPSASITAQPVTLTFRDGAKTRRYTPDFLVRRSVGRAELVEVKYRVDLRANWQRLKPGFVVARTWAHEHGAKFSTATARRIRGPVLENAKRLLPLRRVALDPQIIEHALTITRSLAAPTFRGVLTGLPGNRAENLALLWRLIAQGALRVDLSEPITFDTAVSSS